MSQRPVRGQLSLTQCRKRDPTTIWPHNRASKLWFSDLAKPQCYLSCIRSNTWPGCISSHHSQMLLLVRSQHSKSHCLQKSQTASTRSSSALPFPNILPLYGPGLKPRDDSVAFHLMFADRAARCTVLIPSVSQIGLGYMAGGVG